MAEKTVIQILRGTKAQIETLSPASIAKPVFSTDTNEIYISNGTKYILVGAAIIDNIANRPTASTEGRIFIAQDENNKLYVDTGTSWVASGITELVDMQGDLDNIDDGTTYGKVKNTELETGQVKQVRAVSNLQNVTGDQVYNHINDIAKHRVINDSGSTVTDLWSAEKILLEFANIRDTRARYRKVINYVNNTQAPPTEVSGNRYLLDFTAGGVNSAWDGASVGDIVEFDGAIWNAQSPTEGDIVYVDDENQDRQYVDDGSPEWETRPTAGTDIHNDLSGKQGGTTNEYYHLTQQKHKEATQLAGTDNESGLMSNSDKDKIDNIESGAEVNQTITAQNGVKRTDINGANEDAVLEADYGVDGDVTNSNSDGSNSMGTSVKGAKADHKHVVTSIDGGTIV